MSIESYNAEFKALDEVIKQYKRIQMTPCIDDDFPQVLFEYDQSVRTFLDKCKDNGRGIK